MSSASGKSPGWAAFDLKQRQKQGLEPELDKEPYPPIPSSFTPLRPCRNSASNGRSGRSFSSLLVPSVNFPTLEENKDCKKPMQGGNSGSKQQTKVAEASNLVIAFNKLKELYSWADNSLIEDIMAAVDNDIDKASTLLGAMVSTGSFEENKETIIAELNSTSGNPYENCKLQADNGVFLGNDTVLSELSSTIGDLLIDNNKELTDECGSSGKNLSDDAADMKLILGHMNSIPIEPEWEEDDVYLSHRKDAIRFMRSASRHSRAAANAFRRGDHVSAKQLSVEAKEEWVKAERLNSKAANEILDIRNSNNDLWKLDLHGLHAAEAVQALQEHLWKIETQMPFNRSVSPNRAKTKAGILRSPSLESFGCVDNEELDKQRTLSRQRPTSLQVITGRGNHSRGQAALPTAVRSFLNEQGYRFEEARPGVIAVRPKFRHR